MPNGDYLPECFYCAYYTRWEDIRPCNRHNFVMPHDENFICRDWQLHPKYKEDAFHFDYVPDFLRREEFQALAPGILYYGDYLNYIAFSSFDSLQHLILKVNIHRDDELGWCIYVSDLYRRFLPESGTLLTLRLNGVEHQFKIVDAQRTYESGVGRIGLSGEWEWEVHYSMRDRRIIHCPSSPKALYDWLDRYIDVEARITDKRTGTDGQTWGEIALSLGISAYIEIQEDNTGSMRPRRLPEYKKEFERI